MQGRPGLLIWGCAAALLLASCGKGSKDELVAIVNGEEISAQDIKAELKGVAVPDGPGGQALRKDALERIIDRKLLVQQARNEGIDKTPDYATRKRRADEDLLLNLQGEQDARTLPRPRAGEIQRYMTDNPSLFAQRQLWLVDQLEFTPVRDPRKLMTLKDVHSLDALAAGLQKIGIAFDRGKAMMDTGQLDPRLVQKINALPPGEPFILPLEGRNLAGVIISREPMVATPQIARTTAAQVIDTQARLRRNAATIAGLRSAAEIQYQAGYAPDPKPSAAPTGTTGK